MKLERSGLDDEGHSGFFTYRDVSNFVMQTCQYDTSSVRDVAFVQSCNF